MRFFSYVWVAFILLQSGCGSAHLAAFVNAEGKLSQEPTPLTRRLFAGGDSAGKTNLSRMDTDEESFTNVNTSTGGNESSYDLDKPQFVPYIGPRALSSVAEYLTHIRDHLEALHQSDQEQFEDDITDTEIRMHTTLSAMQHLRRGASNGKHLGGGFHRYDRQHSRRHVTPRIQLHTDGNRMIMTGGGLRPLKNSKQSIEPQPNPTPTFTFRKIAVTSNYKPSWYFTNLGLGKRKKRGPGRKRM